MPATTAPVTQLGVVTDMSTVTPLSIPQGLPGYPLVAMGDSVMLGAAEELGALGFIVDAQVSRQMKTYLPDMQAIKDNGLLGSVVVVHLGTNGSFSDETLAQMMAILADVPVVVVLTSKADREWVAGNNEKVRACRRPIRTSPCSTGRCSGRSVRATASTTTASTSTSRARTTTRA